MTGMRGLDKPPPPRREPRYTQETIYRDSVTVTTVANRVFDAYKVNPTLIAMVLLLLIILGGLGYYMMYNDARIYAYIAARDAQRADLYDRLIEMALKCKDKGPAPDLYPQLEFPQVITKPAPTPNKRDGK